MALKKFKPTTPGQRHKVVVTFDDITTSKPEKSLVMGRSKSGGRNNQGKMTMRYIGGGHKQAYRFVDFRREKDSIPAVVKTIEYDPNRTSRIALVCYADGEKRYILAPQGLKVGQTIMSGSGIAPEIGNTLTLAEIPFGTLIHNIELRPGQGAKMVRSAGAYAQLMSRDGKYAIIFRKSFLKKLFFAVISGFFGLCTEGFAQFLLKFGNVLLIRFHAIGRVKPQTSCLIQEPFRFCSGSEFDSSGGIIAGSLDRADSYSGIPAYFIGVICIL